ncbi:MULTISPECIES: ScbR family autoregulator-binding transcription factor [unclassified Streptomyces]|uniref:ScbR family autoregulator-binding transcription factor n=1 Tax=unclassified Streptomyces TaxID=2593676 RepID=UPI00109E3E76|nr:ScbR family autoregulator-binding transcription factor [Streptomyces sp. A1136]THA54640.1 TetR/AcrR family transcriptional regulator [Streptomyces sp. A1136]
MVKQERAVRTRESLVRAAAEVFAEEGYETASIATISKRAGVSTGGLHFHFGSKTALAEAVVDRAAESLRMITVSRLAGANPLQSLVDSTHDLVALLARDAVVSAAFGLVAGNGARSAVGRERGWAVRRQWQRWVEAMFHEAAAEGLLAEGVSPRDAAAAVVAAIVGFEVLGTDRREWSSRSSLTRYWGLMLPQLVARHRLDDVSAGGSGPATAARSARAGDRPAQAS